MKTSFTTTRRAGLMVLGCVAVALSGCAEVTFKRGAGPGEMQATEQGCREKTATLEAYKACLQAAGFVYARPSGDAVLFGADAAATTPAAQAPAAPGSVEPAGRAGEAAPPTVQAEAKTKADPLAQVTVASWWKLGGTAGGLEADQTSCANTLGDAHRVAPNARLMTLGMVHCLKGKGWFAVGR